LLRVSVALQGRVEAYLLKQIGNPYSGNQSKHKHNRFTTCKENDWPTL